MIFEVLFTVALAGKPECQWSLCPNAQVKRGADGRLWARGMEPGDCVLKGNGTVAEGEAYQLAHQFTGEHVILECDPKAYRKAR